MKEKNFLLIIVTIGGVITIFGSVFSFSIINDFTLVKIVNYFNQPDNNNTVKTESVPLKDRIIGAKKDNFTVNVNENISGKIESVNAKKIYKFNIPESGRFQLSWQSGERDSSKKLFNVRLCNQDKELITYNITSSSNFQEYMPLFIASGDYLIIIEPITSKFLSYNFNLNFKPEKFIETENNNILTKATAIINNQTYSGTLEAKTDIDFYSFTLDQTCAVNITFNIQGSYNIIVINASGEILTEFNIDNNKIIYNTGRLFLKAGDYAVRIKEGISWCKEPYTLRVNTRIESYSEAEINNTPEEANLVPLNMDIQASTGTEKDLDYFTFSLNKKSTVTPLINFEPLNSRLKLYKMTISGIDEEINFTGESKISGKTKYFTLKPGNYILCVSRIKREDLNLNIHEYTLRINAK